MIVNIKELELNKEIYNEIIILYNEFTLMDPLELTFIKIIIYMFT